MGVEDGFISDSEPEFPLFESSSEEDELNILNTRTRRRKRRTQPAGYQNVKRIKEVPNSEGDGAVEDVSVLSGVLPP